ncbi:hypothetical protein [Bradyrhizobium sp.]|jgi:hypothetical protein|uniref:hypothetical protein n=1 Tax=Bradyrhizobium sp. TaxID=376 RepID=UPI002E040014|nr:hypothetical protein [Bradyrhizobium sp.]
MSSELGVAIEDNTNAQFLDELKQFGLKKIGDIEALVTEEFKTAYKESYVASTSIGLVRSLMMYDDISKYFGLGQKFHGMGPDMMHFLELKYKKSEIMEWLDKLGISLLNAPRKIKRSRRSRTRQT